MATRIELSPAPEVERIAERLIERYHGHLDGVGVAYIFTTQELKDGRAPAAAKVQKLTPLQRYLMSGSTAEGDEWAIFVSRDAWAAYSSEQRMALVDHELMHLVIEESEEEDEPGKIVIGPHDVQCFVDEVRRYGPWMPGIENVARQLSLWEAEQSRPLAASAAR